VGGGGGQQFLHVVREAVALHCYSQCCCVEEYSCQFKASEMNFYTHHINYSQGGNGGGSC
jgi:hypothetical protein